MRLQQAVKRIRSALLNKSSVQRYGMLNKIHHQTPKPPSQLIPLPSAEYKGSAQKRWTAFDHETCHFWDALKTFRFLAVIPRGRTSQKVTHPNTSLVRGCLTPKILITVPPLKHYLRLTFQFLRIIAYQRIWAASCSIQDRRHTHKHQRFQK